MRARSENGFRGRGFAALLCAACAACATGDDGGGPCTLAGDAGVPLSLGEIDTTRDSNVHRSPMLRNIFVEIFLDEELSPDVLHLELYGGQGVFRGGEVRPGRFTLSGQESRYDTCGACLLLLVDRSPDTLRPSEYFFAERGDLVIDAVTDRIAGRLENVTLRHVRIDLDDPDGTGPQMPSLATSTASGCRTTITRAEFDLPYD
jgi:hypothetical protein